jgi:hypothetical protein
MKFLDYTLRLSPLAVEKIEEQYDKSIDEIFENKLRSKDVTFILWATVEENVELAEFKKKLSDSLTYTQLFEAFNKLISGDEKNEESVTVDA